VDRFQFAFPVALSEALDSSQQTFETTGSESWYGQTLVSRSGGDAAQSGTIVDNGLSTLIASVQGPGTVTFDWKVSSELNGDYLELYQGGALKERISGEVDWQHKSYVLGAGPQLLIWRYVKNGSGSAGEDSAWIDAFAYTPAPTAARNWEGYEK
jgi:hypothetical protein